MEEVRIVDTTLRDGDISLWAYGMNTATILQPTAERFFGWEY